MIRIFQRNSQVRDCLRFTTFPGGERNVTITEDPRYPSKGVMGSEAMNVRMDFRTSHDIIDLMLLADALDRIGISLPLFIPYLPYARQDRACNPGEALSIKVMMDILGMFWPQEETITVWDPHSDVSGALLPGRQLRIVEQAELAQTLVERLMRNYEGSEFALCSPDAGAEKKSFKLAQRMNLRLMEAGKRRNTVTGKIDFTSVRDPDLWVGYEGNLVIVDDICDGGRTFLELAKEMKKVAPKARRHLYVTHGIFSQGLQPFADVFETILCPNLMNDAFASEFENGVFVVGKFAAT